MDKPKIELVEKYKPLFSFDGRFFVITGGRGSGKSYALASLVAMLSFEKGHKILYSRLTMTSAEISVIPEFLNKLETLGVLELFDVTKDIVRNKVTGSEIIFRGLRGSRGDNTARLKSIEGLTTFVIEEAEEVLDESLFDKVARSVRLKGIQNRIILSLNPATKQHWIYKRFFVDMGVPEGFNGIKDQVCYIHSTYKDNLDNLHPSYIADIEFEKKRNPEKYRLEFEGGWLNRQDDLCFPKPYEYGDMPEDGDSVFGMDFGFSNDPSTLIETKLNRKKGIIYMKLHLYKVGLTTTDIYHKIKDIVGKSTVVGDNSEPRLIAELKQRGINIIPTRKGQGSVQEGIMLLNDYTFIIDTSGSGIHKDGERLSKYLVNELDNYRYDVHGKPKDDWNHCMDALRYAIQYQIDPKRANGKYRFH